MYEDYVDIEDDDLEADDFDDVNNDILMMFS
jgi:hypothetical protein